MRRQEDERRQLARKLVAYNLALLLRPSEQNQVATWVRQNPVRDKGDTHFDVKLEDFFNELVADMEDLIIAKGIIAVETEDGIEPRRSKECTCDIWTLTAKGCECGAVEEQE